MVFTVKGQKCDISREIVEKKMAGVEPDRGRRFFVELNGKRYPVKQVVYLSLRDQVEGLSSIDFSDADARSMLSQIGFDVSIED